MRRGRAALAVLGALLLGVAVLFVARGAHRPPANLPDLDWSDLMSAEARVDNGVTKVDYPAKLRPLDKRQVSLRGWISPINLGDGATVTSFLMTGTPGTCPFCLGTGPEGFVLVSAAVPVPADPTAPLVLRGRFELTPSDPIGFYYRLRDARVGSVKESP